MSEATVTGFRLSPQQRHLWPLQVANPAINAWVAMMLEGPIDIGLLQTALNQVIAGQEALRTTYHSLSGMKIPVQVIADDIQIELRRVELNDAEAERYNRSIDKFIAREVREPFDFERGPLVRTALAALPSGRHLLVVTICALGADCGTLKNLFLEITELYGSPGSVAAVDESLEPVQYLQFSEWQHELLEDSDAEQGREYWSNEELSQLLEAPLQFEGERAPEARFDPQVFSFEINSGMTTALDSLCRRFHTNLSDFLMACWQILHWKLNDGEAIVVGRTFDGRRYEELEKAFGIFSKSLPLRVDLHNEKRFSEALKIVADESREAEQWQDYFQWQAGGGSSAKESPTASPKLTFEYVELAGKERREVGAGETICSLYRFFSCVDRYLIKLVCIRAGEALKAELHYDQSRLGRATVKRLAGNFETLLNSLINDPLDKIGSFRILNDDQLEEIFAALRGPAAPIRGGCIHQLFEEQAAQWPDRTAVAFEDDRITYRRLDERANQLANRLRRMGVGPEVAVGICLERSIDLLVAILGVLKSGGFYVPLDPAYPHDRLSFILEDTGAPVLITERSLAEDISGRQLTAIFMEEERQAIAQESAVKPDAGVDAANLAYAIYTSGSTGRPKGVLVSHENVVHSTLARNAYYHEPLTTYLLLSSFSFDSSVAGLFWTLCSGATLLLPGKGVRREMHKLIELITRHEVSHLLSLPSLHSLLLEESEPEDLESLNCVIVAGEACPLDMPERHRRKSNASLYNEYGPTEGTVWATVYKIEQTAPKQIPIGSSIANTQIYILDNQLQPVPFGVSGEVFIGGKGITRGYLNLPGLSAEKFVPDRLGSTNGSRLYRTGDRARCKPDGQIEFLGRFDQQVKLRGYRIELAEIEAVLGKHSGVQEAVCLVKEVAQGDERLLAFVVPGREHSAVIDGHRRYRLPNNAAIVEHGRKEADFLHKELFDEQIYFKHDISLRDGDCVFDVGAHLGLFTILVNRMRRNLRVYAFEPARPLFELLRINTELYGGQAKLFMCGLSNRVGTATLTFYPNFSMMSGYYADPQAEAQTMKSFILSQQTAESSEQEPNDQYYDELLSARFESEPYGSELRTLHNIIEEDGIEEIDLLKIDVEKSELDVLTGIEENDWRKIKQLVAHVHDIDGRLEEVVSRLTKAGFHTNVEEDQSVAGQGIHYVYARRVGQGISRDYVDSETASTRLAPFDDAILKKADLAAHARERLPDFMVPSSFVLLEALPRLPNGKLNRRALLASVENEDDQDRAFVAPTTPLEKLLARIWADVLKTDRIGIHDNFFDLGGHSFLAIKAHSRLSKTLGREIPLLKLFEFPTLESLASFLEQAEETSAAAAAAQTQGWAEKRRQSMAGQRQTRSADNG